LKLEQIDVIELNEAFAVQSLAVIKRWESIPRGSIPTAGHRPRTPSRLHRREAHLRRSCANSSAANARYGMVTMCIGGGMGAAGIFERIA